MKKAILIFISICVLSVMSGCSGDTTELGWKNKTSSSYPIYQVEWTDSNSTVDQTWNDVLAANDTDTSEIKSVGVLNGYVNAYRDIGGGNITPMAVDVGDGSDNLVLDSGTTNVYSLQVD